MFTEFIEAPASERCDELIYIGIVKSDRRDLFTRMHEHRKAWLGKVIDGQISVRFGSIYTNHKPTGQLIEDIESVLVFGAQPRENTMKKNSFSLYEDIVVTNVGAGRYLKKSYSSAQLRKNGG